MEKVIVVIGPTSVGKTKMGVALAKKFNGEVISGDSMQIYKQMDIGTAKVTEEEKEGIIHHCVDILNPDETYSVHDFQQTVRKKITEITQRGHVPIIVGGTGLYINLPDNKQIKMHPRSGLSIIHGITLADGESIMDSDYTDEYMIGLINLSNKTFFIENGMRLCQLEIADRNEIIWKEKRNKIMLLW